VNRTNLVPCSKRPSIKYGRSDKVNAPENPNREFQDGYRAGVDTLSEDAIKMVNEEGHLRAKVADDLSKGFEEWQRGFWAARSQMAAAGINIVGEPLK
jgi:hypothetical protein